jgi:hypothetical protein
MQGRSTGGSDATIKPKSDRVVLGGRFGDRANNLVVLADVISV